MGAIFGMIHKKGKDIAHSPEQPVTTALAHRLLHGSKSFFSATVFLTAANTITSNHSKSYHLFELNNKVIVADALLFNKDSLCRLLGLDKEAFYSDAQLILLSFLKWQQSCTDYLEGEFVFAIWDKTNQELFIATDPIGYRTVYYHNSDDCFIFCTEIKGIEAVKQTTNYFNTHALARYYRLWATPAETCNKAISLLTGAKQLLLAANKEIVIKQYWQLQPTGKYHFKKTDDWFDCLEAILFTAIERRLNTNANTNTGLMLSGGLDSSTLAAILCRLLKKQNKPLYTFSAVLPQQYTGTATDERIYIEALYKKFDNIIPTYTDGAESNFFSHITESFIAAEDFPFALHYMDYSIVQQAKQQNVHTLFSGFGGDNFLSGKGNTVVYELLRQYRLKEAFATIKQIATVQNTYFIKAFAKNWIPYTQLYNYYKQRNKAKQNIGFKEGVLDTALYQLVQQEGSTHKQQKYLPLVQLVSTIISNGSTAQNLTQMRNYNAFYGIDFTAPFFDKDLNELLADLPVQLFYTMG